MREIIILFFTLLGIYQGFSQNTTLSAAADSVQFAKNIPQKNTVDSLPNLYKTSVKLFPNPVKNKAELQLKGFLAGYVQLLIINNGGKTVREEKRLLISGNENLVIMFSMPPGIYFVLLRQNNIVVKTKMLVQ